MCTRALLNRVALREPFELNVSNYLMPAMARIESLCAHPHSLQSSRYKNKKHKAKSAITSCSHSSPSLSLSVFFSRSLYCKLFCPFAFSPLCPSFEHIFHFVSFHFSLVSPFILFILDFAKCFVCLFSIRIAKTQQRREKKESGMKEDERINERNERLSSHSEYQIVSTSYSYSHSLPLFAFCDAMQCCSIHFVCIWCRRNNYNQWLLHRWPWHFEKTLSSTLATCMSAVRSSIRFQNSDANGF